MVKTVSVALLSFAVVSAILLMIGYGFDIKLLMFTFYEESEEGFEAGGSVIPFLLAIFVSYSVGTAYHKKRYSH